MGATRALRVMLVEDHATFRQALARLLAHELDLEMVAQAGSLAEAREALEGGLKGRLLDVAMLDLALPDGDGRELIGELRRTNPGISVGALSASIEAGHLEEVLRAGADAFLDKTASPSSIAHDVRRLGSADEPPPST